MANSNSNLRVFGSVLVFFFGFLLSTVVPATIPSNGVASSICPKTRKPRLCTKVLNSAGSTDLKVLATFTLNLAHQNAAKSLNLTKFLAATTIDDQLKEQYSSCTENYEEALGNIENAQNKLVMGDFNGINIITSGIMTAVDDCQENLNQSPINTSMLPKIGDTLKNICSVILVISNLLPRPI